MLSEYTVGFSDHSIGVCLPLAAVAIGAKIIEKHFTLDKEMFGWDHKVSRHHKSCEISVPAHNALITQLEVQEFCQLSQKSVRISQEYSHYKIDCER